MVGTKLHLFAKGASLFCGSLFTLIVAASFCAAESLHETHPGDITTHYTDVTYTLDSNPNTGTLTAIGYPDQFDVNNQNIQFDGNNSFNLTLTVDRATGAPLGGTLTITGDTDAVPSYSGLLLQGNITQFYFNPTPASPADGNIFQFVVNVTGGVLAPIYYGSHTAGIIMNIQNNSSPAFTGVFTAPFQNDHTGQFDGLGFSDTFPIAAVPEPAAITLLGLGLGCIAWRSRRRACNRP